MCGDGNEDVVIIVYVCACRAEEEPKGEADEWSDGGHYPQPP